MRKHFSLAPSPETCTWGIAWALVQFCALPQILLWGNTFFRFSEAGLNFLYYFINFLAVLWIFHGYLEKAWKALVKAPVLWLQSVILGLAACGFFQWAAGLCLGRFFPGFHNANDAAMAAMAGSDFLLTALGAVILVPVTEELLFRGLIFGSLARRPWLAYGLSGGLFSLIHVLGYWGSLPPLHLLLSFLQYLPAGIWLAWSCAKSGTVFSSIAIHALINGAALYFTR